MEFLIEITADLDAVPAADRERLLAEERTVAFELKRSGAIKHMWRVRGRPATVSVWEAADAAELEQLVARLPLRRWLAVETTPLDEHYLAQFPLDGNI